jgi:hypothetical protein
MAPSVNNPLKYDCKSKQLSKLRLHKIKAIKDARNIGNLTQKDPQPTPPESLQLSTSSEKIKFQENLKAGS